MSEQPTAPDAPQDAELLRRSAEQYQLARAEVDRLLQPTLAEQAGAANEGAIRARVDRLMFFAAEHLYRAHMAIAAAVASGAVHPQYADDWTRKATMMCVHAVNSTGGLCRNPACDWRGLVADAGPSGVCPKCSQPSIAVAPPKPRLVVPGPGVPVAQA